MTDKTSTDESMSLAEALDSAISEHGDDIDLSTGKSEPETEEIAESSADEQDTAPADETEAKAEKQDEETSETEPDDQESDEADDTDEGEGDEEEKPVTVELSEEEQRLITRWSAEHKELYGQLTGDQRALMMDRFKDAEARVTKATTEAADVRREWADVDAVFEPIRDNLKSYNVSPAQYLQNLSNYAQFMARDPKAAIALLMETESVSLDDLQEAMDGGQVQAAKVKFQQEQATRQAFEQGQRQASHQASIAEQIKTFREAKDDAGNLKYPAFADENVQAQMSKLIRDKHVDSLEEAYNQAIWLVPDHRDAEIRRRAEAQTAQQNEAKEQAKADKAQADRARAAKARRAAGPRKSATGPAQTGQPAGDDLKSIVRQSMAEHGLL